MIQGSEQNAGSRGDAAAEPRLPGSENLLFVEQMFESYLQDPNSVTADWRSYFERFSRGNGSGAYRLGPSFSPRSLFNPVGSNGATLRADDAASLQFRVDALVRNYRVRAHVVANINPLAKPGPPPPELIPSYFGMTDSDLDRVVANHSFADGEPMKLRELFERLRNTYCRSIGVQFMHIDNLQVRDWIQKRIERTQNHLALSRDEQLRILTRLTDAVVFEEFILRKFIGAKSFSLQGSESLIPLLDLAFEKAGEQGIMEIVVGMAHRGRLNVLASVLGKSPKEIFRAFEDLDPQLFTGRGDVKYHLGHSGEWTTSKGRKIHLSLCFNPSHLEYVNPVALGRTRAKMDHYGDCAHEKGLTLQIHGDAAFSGQGISQETLNLSELTAYSTGGSLHVITNNQLGFTTGPNQGRSSTYASDVMKMLQSPIFHVNGEDPEAVAQVVQVAMDFRKEFKRDVLIDMYGYRRLGHNETDEPSYTQPILYDTISKRKSVREGYLEHILTLNGISREEADQIAKERRDWLEKELSVARSDEYRPAADALKGGWVGKTGGRDADTPDVETSVSKERLAHLLEKQTRLPERFALHPKLERHMQSRRDMAAGKRPLDWAAGEALAFATLATEGHPIRMSGQDVERGTFSHRHSVLHDHKSGARFEVFQNLEDGQAPVEIYNSSLSEMAVLGFEYGYSLDSPEGLVVWEAQFGDFNNAAQVMIDQFVSSAEIKWHRLSGLVMQLPHGMEGQGPEHSSARLERFLQLCAEDNMFVCYLTTPAQLFHCLRRQVLRPMRKPLIMMSPKSLLRHPLAISSLDDLAEGRFQRVLQDRLPPEDVTKILVCAGKVYYDLATMREEEQRHDVAIVRVEQLYPFPDKQFADTLARYREGTPVVWVQEEPENMGAWRYLLVKFGATVLGKHPLTCVSRAESSSPATGSLTSHKLEQAEIMERAFE